MADDEEILKEIWGGDIPICFTLAQEDCVSVTSPEPYYVLVPRMGYFSLVTEKVKKLFSRNVSSGNAENEVWIEYNGIPLQWHYFIGLLFDLYTDSSSVPWNLNVHFSSFPTNQLLQRPSREALESIHFSALKQADTLKQKTPIMSCMPQHERKQLWTGLCNGQFDQFWTINKKLMKSSEDNFNSIPFKIYFQPKTPSQRLFKPISEDGKQLSLKDLILQFISEEKLADTKVVIQGIEPCLDIPIQWLSEHFSHPDNFLHIVCSSA